MNLSAKLDEQEKKNRRDDLTSSEKRLRRIGLPLATAALTASAVWGLKHAADVNADHPTPVRDTVPVTQHLEHSRQIMVIEEESRPQPIVVNPADPQPANSPETITISETK